ncbi:MAG: hypothetical protein A7315_13095 [Candidatus Altiarchaeales archaeon WOR_SM1_79]|nr:MAG: hypothetical protein A7315_13095 [Candidatus Altiarchaeales archaeon WOR_SM1_79]
MLNPDISYLLGMIVGKGQIIRGNKETELIIDLPHKNLVIEGENTQQSIKASLLDMVWRLKSLIGADMNWDTTKPNVAHITFSKPNGDYLIRTINNYLKNETTWRDFRIPKEIFNASTDIKKEFLRGLADVTGHIRKSNIAWKDFEYRVYVEIMTNWESCIDISNLLKDLDVPVQTIRFAHPNIVDPTLKFYNKGMRNYKEHQIKIWAEEFEKIGFNIEHKNKLLKKFADLNRKNWEKYASQTKKYKGKPISEAHHKFYWETRDIKKKKQKHPDENHPSIHPKIRGKHFDSWKEIAKELGYHE